MASGPGFSAGAGGGDRNVSAAYGDRVKAGAERHLAPDYPTPALSGLRALSILAVIVSHTGLQNRVPGVFGVTVLFFISGFLVTTLVIGEHRRSGTIAVGAFYMRRLLRLYPPLIVSVAVTSAAWVSYRDIKRPVMGLRRRFESRVAAMDATLRLPR